MLSTARVPVENFGAAPAKWDECNICFDQKNELLKGHTAGKVFHKYHESCLNTWLKQNSSCPECRQPLRSRDINVISADQALIQLELNFPGILNAPREFLKEAVRQLKISVPISSILVVAYALHSNHMPLELSHVISGGIIGYTASHIVRHTTGEESSAYHYENDLERITYIMKSKPFKGALIGSATLGLAVSTGSFLLTSLPLFIAGIGVRYGVEKLYEEGYITEESKAQMQWVTTVVSSALALILPIREVASILIGGFLGATVEAHVAAGRVENLESE